jgi:hypothetical protein
MTPLVLLFIGVSMRLTWHQVRTIFSFLFFRSGIAFLISGVLLLLFPVADVPTMLLIVVFPQSACSFWPYAHMAAVSKLEGTAKTFDLDFAMNVLACSMPFSVILILLIYASGSFFVGTTNVFICAAILLTVAVVITVLATKAVQAYRDPLEMNTSAGEGKNATASS